MLQFKQEISVILITGMIAGCAVDCTKPDTGGFIAGVVCLSKSDGYSKKQAEREQVVKMTEIERDQVKLEGEELTTELATLTTTVDQQDKRIKDLTKDLAQLKTTNATANDTKGKLLRDLKTLNKRLVTIKKEIAKSEKSESLQQGQMDKYKAQAAELERAVDELIELYDTIA